MYRELLLGALITTQKHYEYVKSSRLHFDLIYKNIKSAIAISPILWPFKHIEGHQDDHVSYSNLDRWAQLNVQADEAAKQKARRCMNSPNRPFWRTATLPYETCSVHIRKSNGEHQRICSSLQHKALIMHKSSLEIRDYWK